MSHNGPLCAYGVRAKTPPIPRTTFRTPFRGASAASDAALALISFASRWPLSGYLKNAPKIALAALRAAPSTSPAIKRTIANSTKLKPAWRVRERSSERQDLRSTSSLRLRSFRPLHIISEGCRKVYPGSLRIRNYDAPLCCADLSAPTSAPGPKTDLRCRPVALMLIALRLIIAINRRTLD